MLLPIFDETDLNLNSFLNLLVKQIDFLFIQIEIELH